MMPVDSVPPPSYIRTIEIHRSDIFDSSETNHWYARVVNALHFMSREHLVSRELLFRIGDPYDSAQVAETARNLRRLGLFRKVKIDSVSTDSGLTMKVVTKDGWTTKTDARFRSTGKQTDWGVTISEGNVLGTGTKLLARYRKTPDRSDLLFQFRQPRFLAKSVLLGVGFDNLSDGHRASLSIERPFYSLEDHKGIAFLGEYRKERVLRFTNGQGTASDTLQRRYGLARIDAAKALRAGTGGYVRLGVTTQMRRDNYVPESFAGGVPNDITATAGPFIEWRHANFVVTKGFVGLGREEDVDVSTTARLSLSVAPKAFGYLKDGMAPLLTLHGGRRFSHGFAFADLRAGGLYTSSGLDSGSVTLTGTLVLQSSRRSQALIHAEAGWIRNPAPGTEFDYGFAFGPRAFPIHAFTGDRAYFGTAEYRFTIAEDFLHLVGLGIAAFGDHGGAWFDGSPHRSGNDLGLGLRLSQSRAAELEPVRIDFAYRFKNDVEKQGWVVVLAKGLTFQTPIR
jgi:hypothetical protein